MSGYDDIKTLAELHDLIVRDHKDKPHPELEKGTLKAHLLIHGLVEKQLFENSPPESRQALAALVKAGKTRHDAVHIIGRVATQEAMAMMREDRQLNPQRYAQALGELMESVPE